MCDGLFITKAEGAYIMSVPLIQYSGQFIGEVKMLGLTVI